MSLLFLSFPVIKTSSILRERYKKLLDLEKFNLSRNEKLLKKLSLIYEIEKIFFESLRTLSKKKRDVFLLALLSLEENQPSFKDDYLKVGASLSDAFLFNNKKGREYNQLILALSRLGYVVPSVEKDILSRMLEEKAISDFKNYIEACIYINRAIDVNRRLLGMA